MPRVRLHYAFLWVAHAIAAWTLLTRFSWSGLSLAFSLQVLFGCLGITLCYHRLLTHRSFSVPTWLERGLACLGVLALQGDPIEWVAVHRQHHRFADRDGDPHDASRGFFWSHMGWIDRNYFPFVTDGHLASYAGDLYRQPFYRRLRSLQLPMVGGFVAGLWSGGGLDGVLYGLFVRLVVGDHCTWFVNSAGHAFGWQAYPRDDLSTNCWWAGLLSFGEAFHNNHHAFPSSARHGLSWWQLDVTWWVIRGLELIGLAREVRLPSPDELAAALPPPGLAAALGLVRPEAMLVEHRRRVFLSEHHPAVLSTRKRRKVLMVSASTYEADGSVFRGKRLNSPALTFPLLAALTPPHWEVELVYEACESVPFDTDADLVAIGNMGHSLWRALDLAAEFRRRGKHVAFGGNMSSLIPDWVQDHCDTLLVGDVEETWARFLEDFEAGKPATRYAETRRHPIEDLPVPRYDLLAGRATIGALWPVQVARGCPYRCQFCTIAALSQGSYTPRPVEHVVRDIRAAMRFGQRAFFFLDDNIAGDRDYARRLFEAVAPLGILWVSQSTFDILKDPDLLPAAVASGCVTLCFGMESLEQASLNSVRKGFYRADRYVDQIRAIRESGLYQSAEFIIGMDHDTPESLDRLAEFIVDQGIPLVRLYVYAPIPGTRVWQDFQAQGRLLGDGYRRIGGANVGFVPAHFQPDELLAAYWKLQDRIYSWPAILRRVFRRPFGSWLRALLVLAANLDYRRMVRRRIVPGLT